MADRNAAPRGVRGKIGEERIYRGGADRRPPQRCAAVCALSGGGFSGVVGGGNVDYELVSGNLYHFGAVVMVPFLPIAVHPVFLGWSRAACENGRQRISSLLMNCCSPATVRLYADNAVTVTPTLTLYDQYALIRECVETPDLVILIKDRERQLVIPKRCLPTEKREEILEFLRLTFIRRRRVMRSWLF